MEELRANSVEDLQLLLSKLPRDVLFRGQATHYVKDGNPSVITSFDRQGCIPSQMVKWSRYASNVLETFIGAEAQSLSFTQALLQHYGWRSFFVDCSASPAVGAWFASHSYSDGRSVELCEDFEERPVMLVKRRANYTFKDGDGHLYVFNKAKSAGLIGATDLANLDIKNARPRTSAQSAWLLGPLRNETVPNECFTAHITASTAIFRDFAESCGLDSTNDLFPTADEDPILNALLHLPWKEVEGGKEVGIPFFRRALDLPEYEDSYKKISPSRVAFFRKATVAEFGSIEGIPYGGATISVPEITLFGTADPAPLRFPKINELLNEHRSVAFEIDDIIKHASMQNTVLYQKGVAVLAHDPRLIEVCELMVEHPGLDMTRAGINQGWYYRVEESGEWARVSHVRQCPCGNEEVHTRHISALHIIEAFLAAPEDFA